MSNLYAQRGYKSRTDYLRRIAQDYCASVEMVRSWANGFGEAEDFEKLIEKLEEWAEGEDD